MKWGVKKLNYQNQQDDSKKLVCEERKVEKISLYSSTLETLRETWFALGFKKGAMIGKDASDEEIKRCYLKIRGTAKWFIFRLNFFYLLTYSKNSFWNSEKGIWKTFLITLLWLLLVKIPVIYWWNILLHIFLSNNQQYRQIRNIKKAILFSTFSWVSSSWLVL